jgi:cysteine-rich repeat protein
VLLAIAALVACSSEAVDPTPDGAVDPTPDSAPPACGNFVTEAGEACDDGNAVDGDGCDAGCVITGCGNGVRAGDEECDDGGTAPGDGCSAICGVEVCGNGIVDPGEACDLGAQGSNSGACLLSCQLAACGDGHVHAGVEGCDDGGTTAGDGCSAICGVEVCGNGIVDPGEACDLGSLNSNSGACLPSCQPAACGDGHVQAGLEQCDDGNVAGGDGCDSDCTLELGTYLKASNAGAGRMFGNSIAVSADGNTLAVGSAYEPSGATGVGGDQTDSSAPNAGAVYVFTRSGATWIQQAYLKASNTDAGDGFGSSVALSADGSTLAVGAASEASAATGVGGDQADDSAPSAGAVYVFTRSGATWIQQAYLKASNTDAGDAFGLSVALSSDGATLAVGTLFESSAATGVGGDQADDSAILAGAVYVFARSGAMWSQQAYLKASNTEAEDYFGISVALSGDGSLLAVGAHGEDSAATGIDGDQQDNSLQVSGAVYVFGRTGAIWSQRAYVKASNTGQPDGFGMSVALSVDGSTLAVGAPFEQSAATGVGGNGADNTAVMSGAVYVFARSGASWSPQAYVKASNTDERDQFGTAVALSADGSTLMVGAPAEDSAAVGTGGDQADDSKDDAGAVYVLARSGTTWAQQAYLKAFNTDEDDHFGGAVALSADGSTWAVSAFNEDSAATGIEGDQSSNAAPDAGAVYVIP